MTDERDDGTAGQLIVGPDKTVHQKYAYDPDWANREHRLYLSFLVASSRRSEFPGYSDPRGDGRIATLTPTLPVYPGDPADA